MLNLPTDWLSPAILTIAAGLSNAKVRSPQFHNLIRCNDLVQLLRFPPLRGEFGQLAYMSDIFSLRVPSETLQLVRAFSNDQIAEYKKQDTNSLIGVRTYNATAIHVVKFSFRGNIRNGCILERPCICQDVNKSSTRDWCPVRAVWPYIQKRVKTGDFIFPSFTRENTNRIPKKTMALAGFDSGGI